MHIDNRQVCTTQFPPDNNNSLGVTASPVKLETGCVSESQTFSDFLSKFQDNQLSEAELLKIFNIDENELRQVLQPAAKLFIHLFYFFKSGKILSDSDSAVVLRNEFPQLDLDTIFANRPVELSTLLKLLVNINV